MKNTMKILSRVVLIAAFGIILSFAIRTEVKAYTVTGYSDQYGSVAPDKTAANEGETVTLTIAAGSRCELISFYLNPNTPLSGTGNTRTFTMPAHDVTVVAVFMQRHEMTVTKDDHIATVNPPAPLYRVEGTNISISATVTEEDYEFDQWTIVSGSGSFASATSATTTFTWGDEDTTIKANSRLKPTYSITFDANGGTVNPSSGTTGRNGKLASLPEPSWANHDFIGWFTAQNGGTQVSPNTVFTGNDTIYAHWKHRITFDLNGGNIGGSTANITRITGTDGKLTEFPQVQYDGHTFVGWFDENTSMTTAVTLAREYTADTTLKAHWADSNTVNVNVTFKVKNGSWNDGTRTNKTKNLWRYENQDLALQLTAADIPGVGNNPDSGYRAGSWDVEPPIGTNLSNESRNLTYTYTYAGSGSSGSKKSDDSDHHEDSSSPEKPSWTPAKAAATIAAQKVQKQQAAATQLASIQTMLRTKTSDRAGTGRNVIDIDMTKVDILDPATVNLLLLNNRFAFNVKITVPGGMTTTIMIPANFNFRPFIKADGTMNIHEVLWWIISKKK